MVETSAVSVFCCLYFVVRKYLNLSVVVWYQEGERVLAMHVQVCHLLVSMLVSGPVSMHVVSFCVLQFRRQSVHKFSKVFALS